MGEITADEAILNAMKALGGTRSVKEVGDWVESHYPLRWKGIGTQMADLTFKGNRSSGYAPDRQFLERVSRGHYRLRASYVEDRTRRSTTR